MSANANNARPQGQAPLNPERPPMLLGKYAKMIGRELKDITLTYDADGITVNFTGMENTPYATLKDGNIAEFKRLRAASLAPSEEDKLQSFKNKYELRLNLEFPADGPANGSDEAIQGFLNRLPFRQRRALLMTQKQFSAQYPNGYTQA